MLSQAIRYLQKTLAGLSAPALLIAFFAQPALPQDGLNISFGPSGLASLKYNGIDFLLYGDLRVNQVTFSNPNGSPFAGATESTVSVDSAAQSQTRTYNWGTIVARYALAGSQLNVAVTISNTSAQPLQQIWFEALGLRFPSSVTNYDGSNPIIFNTLGQPAIAVLRSATASVAVAADDVAKPLQLGFPYSFDRPANTQFPIDLNTGTVSTYPNSFPVINRSIPAGGSDQFRFSLRFGPSGSTATTLAGDIYRSYAAAFPPQLNWVDRRAIGQLILGTSAAGYPNNPRGWFLDRTLDVTTPAGVAAFQQKVLQFATNSIAILKQMNAQGMVTWDIEGEQFAQPVSYIGDPRVFASLAPEMAGIADQYFQAFRTAGLRVGVCLRPQQLQVAPGNSSAQQIPLADPTQSLLEKATYAHDRWGATLFYIDSNVNATDPNPTDPAVLRTLSAAFPDSLFIPEHSNTQYFAYSAPYRELRQGFTSTPSDVRFTYPKAFTVIYTPDGALSQYFSALVSAVQAGDILMFRSWFADPQNAQVLSIYQAAGGTSPSVTVSVNPIAASLNAGQSQQFSATVTGATSTQVTWSISPAGVGAISTTGLYSAPAVLASAQSVSVIATSTADPAKSGAATVNITPLAPVSITITPTVASLTAGQSQQFNAIVTGTTNTGVTWVASPAGTGSLSATGLYTAPVSIASSQTVTITALSAANPSKTASAAITLVPAAAPVAASCGAPATGAFTGCYYSDRGYTQLAFSRVDPQINFLWSGTGPGTGIGPTQYAVRWQGNIAFAEGVYQFNMATDDGSRLFVDGKLIIDAWGEHPAIPIAATVPLSSGTHLIRMDYFQLDGSASASLNWNLTGAVPPVTVPPVTVPPVTTPPVTVPPVTVPITVSVSPQTVNVLSGQMQPFAATVTGTSNTQVLWSLSPPNAGSISPAGIYTAPVVTVPQAVTVRAASVADPAKSASATATVNPAASSCGAPAVNAFTGCYYSERSFDPSVFAFTRVDPAINFVWTAAGPGGKVGQSNYQVRWQGNFSFAAGNYVFTTTTDDGSRLYIDGQLTIDYWGEHPAIPFSKAITLTAGSHLVQLEYMQLTGAASANLTWRIAP